MRRMSAVDRVFLIFLLIFVALQLFFLFRYQMLGWDESVYVGMAKYISSVGKQGLWEDLRPVGLPLVLSVIWSLPIKTYSLIIISKVLMVFISVAILVLIYLIGKKVNNKRIGLVAAFLTATSLVFITNAELIHTELLSTVFALIALYFFVQTKTIRNVQLVRAGFFFGLSFLTKFPQGILLLAFLCVILLNRNVKNRLRHCSLLFLTFCCTVLPFFVLNFVFYGNPLIPFMTALPHQNNVAFSVITGTMFSWIYHFFYYAVELLKQNILLIFCIPGMIFFVGKKEFCDLRKSVVVFAFVFLAAYFSLIVNKQVRFSLLFLPYLAFLASQGFFAMHAFFNVKKLQKFFVAMTAVLLLVLFATVIKETMQYYDTLPSSAPIILQFYRFADEHNVKSPVLAANPIPAAYSNKLFIPFYQDVDAAIKIYGVNENVSAVMYTTEFYPCKILSNVQVCEQKKHELVAMIAAKRKKVFSINYGQEYSVYLR